MRGGIPRRCAPDPRGYAGATTERVWAAGFELGSFRREKSVGGISCQMQCRGIQRRQMQHRGIQRETRWSARAGGAPAP